MNPNNIDCVISKVHYSPTEPHIIQSVMVNNYGASTPPTESKKFEIVTRMMLGEIVWTIYDGGKLGAQVRRVKDTRGATYLRTVPDDIKEDNLGDLPTF